MRVAAKKHIMCDTSVNLMPCCGKHTSRYFKVHKGTCVEP